MDVEVNGLAVNVTVPPELRWQDERRGVPYELSSITVRLLPDGGLAAKAYGRPVAGGRGGYVSFTVPDRCDLQDLIRAGAERAAASCAAVSTGQGSTEQGSMEQE